MIHLIGIPALIAVASYAGYKYGSRGVAAVKAEIVTIESDAKNGLTIEKKAILNTVARIKSIL